MTSDLHCPHQTTKVLKTQLACFGLLVWCDLATRTYCHWEVRHLWEDKHIPSKTKDCLPLFQAVPSTAQVHTRPGRPRTLAIRLSRWCWENKYPVCTCSAVWWFHFYRFTAQALLERERIEQPRNFGCTLENERPAINPTPAVLTEGCYCPFTLQKMPTHLGWCKNWSATSSGIVLRFLQMLLLPTHGAEILQFIYSLLKKVKLRVAIFILIIRSAIL